MNGEDQTKAIGPDSTFVSRDVVETPTRVRVLDELRRFPELAKDRSLIIEKAVSDFFDLARRPAAPSLEEYCARFAQLGESIDSSIYRQVEVERVIRSSDLDAIESEPTSWPQRGERCGSFSILQELGRGALARVYLCTQPDIGDRQVVVKVSTSAMAEADALGRLRHPNIVPIHFVEVDSRTGWVLLCMPFLGRSTWRDLVDVFSDNVKARSPLKSAACRWELPTDRYDPHAAAQQHRAIGYSEPQECIAFAGARLADALVHAHSQGILHGDVKPSNILLSRGGVPLLMDFNLCANASLATRAKGGTLPYMPPEQLRSIVGMGLEGARYDHRSDLFSLGVVLYESLVGRSPFPVQKAAGSDDLDPNRLLERQAKGCVPLRTLDKSIPATLADAIEQCLEVRPQHRHASAAELCELLEKELSPRRRLGRKVRRRPRTAAAAGLVLALFLAGGAAREALKPPRHVQLYEEAIELAEHKDFAAAEQNLRTALLLRPDYGDAMFELGHMALVRNELTHAGEWFDKLHGIEQSPRGAAYFAYCFLKEGHPEAALLWNERALERGGKVAEVYNNLSFAYQMGVGPQGDAEGMNKAEANIRRALQMAPNSPPICLNAILLSVRRAESDNVPVPDEIIDTCRRVASLCPDSGLVQLSAARALALASSNKDENCAFAISCLERAHALGSAPTAEILDREQEWSGCRENPRFKRLLKKMEAEPRPPHHPETVSRLMEPLSFARVGLKSL
jgi:serine/threonine protein kinase/Tfp pilus assembly protein PilF